MLSAYFRCGVAAEQCASWLAGQFTLDTATWCPGSCGGNQWAHPAGQPCWPGQHRLQRCQPSMTWHNWKRGVAPSYSNTQNPQHPTYLHSLLSQWVAGPRPRRACCVWPHSSLPHAGHGGSSCYPRGADILWQQRGRWAGQAVITVGAGRGALARQQWSRWAGQAVATVGAGRNALACYGHTCPQQLRCSAKRLEAHRALPRFSWAWNPRTLLLGTGSCLCGRGVVVSGLRQGVATSSVLKLAACVPAGASASSQQLRKLERGVSEQQLVRVQQEVRQAGRSTSLPANEWAWAARGHA